jgi:UDP-N-acetylglucosamine 2-epimerase (non-hydrolysing)
MKKISVIFGTRPEAIKLAPVILEFKKYPNQINCRICVTAQHRQMLDQVLEVFNIVPDIDLDLMEENQTLAGFTAKAMTSLDKYIIEDKPDLILVQGDTTTVFCAALTAFYNKIPVAHVEAGLRTGNIFAPWPEEINRILATKLTSFHFPPTNWGKNNLIKEGISEDKINVTGNTVIDALFIALDQVKLKKPTIPGLPNNDFSVFHDQKVVLITGHRRENFGDGFDSICHAIAKLSDKFPDVHFVYPVHLNPKVQEPVNRILGVEHKRNIHLIKPLGYLPFVALMNRSYLILTDSGGIQEEAPSLGKPVLVMRDVTERPEGIAAGIVKLVGTNETTIIEEVSKLLMNSNYHQKMVNKVNPYGDGHASERITNYILKQ